MVAENLDIQKGLGIWVGEISTKTLLCKTPPPAHETWIAGGWKQILEKYSQLLLTLSVCFVWHLLSWPVLETGYWISNLTVHSFSLHHIELLRCVSWLACSIHSVWGGKKIP